MTRRYDPTVSEAAEYLYAVLDEFKASNDTAALALRRARVLLDVCVNEAMRAVAANVKK
jgi:hypothetical protein